MDFSRRLYRWASEGVDMYVKRWPMHMDQPNITKVGDHLELVSHAHMIACPQICEKGPRPIKKSLDLPNNMSVGSPGC